MKGLLTFFLITVFILFGCKRDEPAVPWEFEREVIGVILLSESESTELTFHLNAQVWETWFGFSTSCTVGGSVCSNLELRVSLYSNGSDEPFCRFDVGPENLMRCDWFHDHSVIVKNTEPFLFRSPPSSDFRYPSVFYHGRNIYPLNNGILVSDADYRMEIKPLRVVETAADIEIFLYKRLRPESVQAGAVTNR